MAKCLEGLEFVQISKAGETGSMVMQVSYPHIIGSLVFIAQEKQDEIENFMRSLANGETLAKVKGYSIFVLPGGTLDRENVAPGKMKDILEQMAGYMSSDILPGRESRYNKFKEDYQRRPRLSQSREDNRRFKEMRLARKAARMNEEQD